MAMTLLRMKNFLKSSRGLTRDREDGNLPDDLLEEAISNGIERVARDCDLNPIMKKFHLVAGQWEYPIPENVTGIRDFWREDTNGVRQPLSQITQEKFWAGHDPEDNTTTDPNQYAYPIMQGRVFQFYVKAPANYDFVPESRITSATRRTVIDTGANFGRTLSGDRISPGDVVQNRTGKSYGYVKVLDTITAKQSGNTTGASSTTVTVNAVDFDALGVNVDDIIVSPNTGIPTTYAFVTEISGDTLTYEDIRGALSEFTVGLGIRVGQAQKIVLSTDAPHRGLRSGTYNYFFVDALVDTIVATVFTDTRCTGNGIADSEVGQEAIAAGGSHGKISEVTDTYVDVEKWIGGRPVDGEVVTTRACDEYQVETEPRIQPVVWLKSTPSTSDTEGEERLWASFDEKPYVPTEDWQYIDVPDKWEDALRACCEWQTAKLSGTHTTRQINDYRQIYLDEVRGHQGDIHEVARGEIMTVYGNRFRSGSGHEYTGVNSGIPWDGDAMLDEQN